MDATIIHAPSSTKNEKKQRDPAMHQTRKGQQWYFGLKAHIDVDAKQGIVHSVATTAAWWRTSICCPSLLHGEESKVYHPTDEDLSAGTQVWGDGGYQGQTAAIREPAPHAQDMTCRRTKFKNHVDEVQKKKNTENGDLECLCHVSRRPS